ncbi:hypothetical protein B0T16DRAFT_418009 [Cercophora newfieldiana]|uniref:Uncharacterized protein n=1 Tax=Cercophora newfieldiana TaxID=92897 RepID=A0AA39Y2P4_9PEZI|nr:hypothetical protein B0T16DRAFT_418009 [Cercophora newfieldiana]
MAFSPHPSPVSEDDRRKRGRLRRSEATSSDSSDSGEFDIFSVPLRVGAPPPHPFPVDSDWDESCTEIDRCIGERVLVEGTRSILSEEKVNYVESVDLVTRTPLRSGGVIAKGQPTILIVARWVDAGCSVIWGNAVPKIKKFIDGTCSATGNSKLDIAVEMLAEEHVQEKYIAPVAAELLSLGLEKDWEEIKDTVGRILDGYSQTKGYVTSINLFRLGVNPDHDNQNTVYVSVDYQCLETKWAPVLEDIRRYLQQGRFTYADLRVHMEHGVIEPSALRVIPSTKDAVEQYLIPPIPYPIRANLGADISAEKYITTEEHTESSPLIGTLGCWLELKSQGRPQWFKVALTNYHVIRPWCQGFRLSKAGKEADILEPVPGSQLWLADENGILPSDPNRPRVESPSRCKHSNAVRLQHLHMERFPNTSVGRNAKADLPGQLDFFDRDLHRLGTVYCASGYGRRTAKNGRLDWALIMPHDAARIGENRLPEIQDWYDKYKRDLDAADSNGLPNEGTDEALLRQPPDTGLKEVLQGSYVFKKGAISGISAGKYSKTAANVTVHEDPHIAKGLPTPLSTELAFVHQGTVNHGYASLFARNGDSGSIVWDEDGRALGLVFTGQKVTGANKHKLVYITPLEEVFDDIKKLSGGRITHIRIAE